MATVALPCQRATYTYIHIHTHTYTTNKLKGQCIGIEAMQSHVISQTVNSLLSIVLQEFVEFMINNSGTIVQSET